MALSKLESKKRIQRRIRAKISGTAERPRLCVNRSNKQIYAQIVNDVTGTTLVHATSKELEKGGNKVEQATKVGELIAKKALEAGVSTCVFDRGGYLYHGRVKSLGDGARNGGLKF